VGWVWPGDFDTTALTPALSPGRGGMVASWQTYRELPGLSLPV